MVAVGVAVAVAVTAARTVVVQVYLTAAARPLACSRRTSAKTRAVSTRSAIDACDGTACG